MEKFELKADIRFKAKDLDSACQLLSDHFVGLINCNSEFEFEGSLSIEKEKKPDIGPTFEQELRQFYFNLTEKQEQLGDPFDRVLHENRKDLYAK